MPGFSSMGGVFKQQIDDKVIKDTSGMGNAYIERVIKVLHQEKKSISPQQVTIVLKNCNFKDKQIYAAEKLAPYVKCLTADGMIDMIKAVSFNEPKLAIVTHMRFVLSPMTSYDQKVKIAEKMTFMSDRDICKKLLGI